MSALVEVIVRTPVDARHAAEGGADRLMVVGELGGQGRSAEPAQVERIIEASSLPVRPLLRLREGYSTDGGEMLRLRGLVSTYLASGAEGVVCGFLNGLSLIDLSVLDALTADQPPFPFSFDRAIDHCLDADAAWESLADYPGCDQVITAGSPRGLSVGLDDVVERARTNPRHAEMIMVGGGVTSEHVVWLARAGVRAFQLGAQVREDGTYATDVSAARVHTWRLVVDTETNR